MISHDHKMIFVHIPKCAGTSVEAFFGHHKDHSGRDRQDHRTIRDIERPVPVFAAFGGRDNRRILRRRQTHALRKKRNVRNGNTVSADQYRDYFKFTVIRDPWSRVHSWYRNVVRDNQHRSNHCAFGNFHEFAEKFAGRGMLAPIDYWIRSFDGAVRMDKILRVETLAEDIQKVGKDLGIAKIELPHLLESSDKRDIRDQYDDRTRALIDQRYTTEIEAYGFSFAQV